MNKCLAQTHNERGPKRLISGSDTGSAAQLRAPTTGRPVTGQSCRSSADAKLRKDRGSKTQTRRTPLPRIVLIAAAVAMSTVGLVYVLSRLGNTVCAIKGNVSGFTGVVRVNAGREVFRNAAVAMKLLYSATVRTRAVAARSNQGCWLAAFGLCGKWNRTL